ncbi:Glycerol-3-phosphate acyltransferase 4 [Nymphon striatum]|nr:Glycerol-3-phosphate acyltransferase 4 [Nymphon striatum]
MTIWLNYGIKLLFLGSLPVFVLVFGVVLTLASFGKSLGIRRKYVQLLLWIFEWGRKKIEKAEKIKTKADRSSSVEEKFSHDDKNLESAVPLQNGDIVSDIVSDDPITGQEKSAGKSFTELKKEFHLSDSLDYIKHGVETIIDDEVTKRFSAEGKCHFMVIFIIKCIEDVKKW